MSFPKMEKAQLLKGSLELAVLSLLARKGERYGYAIVQELKKVHPVLKSGEGTIYPLLIRLENAGFVKGRWDVKDNRKIHYYSLTRKGKAELKMRRAVWRALASSMLRILRPA